MRQQYRGQSLFAWMFWGALLVGGTLYGAYRFDWFPIGLPSPLSAPPTAANGKPGPNAEKVPAQSPPDGQIEVAQGPTGPQSEPPVSELDEPARSPVGSTKARLLEQRLEAPAPKLHANAAMTASVQPANISDIAASRSPFDLDSHRPEPTAATALPKAGPIVQAAAHVVEEKPASNLDPRLEAQLESIDVSLQSGDLLRAHRDLSTLYWAKPQWRPVIRERIEKTAQAIYFDPQTHFLKPYEVKPKDQFAVFARQYNVPWQYLAKLNHVDPKRIRPGQQLKVIKGPFCAIVELNHFLLTVHAYGYYVRAYPIGVGKENATPAGKFTVLNKVVRPQYTDPDGHVIEGGDPDNPLGHCWLDLGKGYGIHGTIDPASIGKAESRGCIRLRNEDVEELYDMLVVGSEVSIRR